MKRIGITGNNGFIGYHLIQTLNLFPNEFELIEFNRCFFDDNIKLDEFVSKCDVIVHLAAVNRCENESELYNINLNLTRLLISSLQRVNNKIHVLFSSSIQEQENNIYGNSKLISRTELSNWAKNNERNFTGLLIPNIFGPFCKPYYNSVVATFSHQLINDIKPQIINDSIVKLLYIGDLVDLIIKLIRIEDNTHNYIVDFYVEKRVSDILNNLILFKDSYIKNNTFPKFLTNFDIQLFNTFRSHLELKLYFPQLLKKNSDNRGVFVELLKSNSHNQISFSTTLPNIVRGNHFHTRKVERFIVIKGTAKIQLRKIGTNKVFEFILDGNNPCYIDIPVWYTHNLKNIGEDILFTIFWINESYDISNPDTYFEIV